MRFTNILSVLALLLIIAGSLPAQTEKSIPFNEAFIPQGAVQLEVIPESMLYFPCDICIVDTFFCVTSRDSRIRVFGKSGKYIKSLGKVGAGAGGYKHISGIFPAETSKFGVYDWEGRKIIIYNINDGPSEEHSMKMNGVYSLSSVVFYNESYYARFPFSKEYPYSAVKFDSFLILIKALLRPIPITLAIFLMRSRMAAYI